MDKSSSPESYIKSGKHCICSCLILFVPYSEQRVYLPVNFRVGVTPSPGFSSG
jgi:hypothetical protein